MRQFVTVVKRVITRKSCVVATGAVMIKEQNFGIQEVGIQLSLKAFFLPYLMSAVIISPKVY